MTINVYEYEIKILNHKLEWSAPRSTCVTCRRLVNKKKKSDEKSVPKMSDEKV